jgi:hypothetical protein
MNDILVNPKNLIELIEEVTPHPSVLSPMAALRAALEHDQTPQRKDMILSPVTTPLIQTLAQPWAVGTLVYHGRGMYIDTSVYVADKQDAPVVQVSSQDDKLRLQSPPAVDATSLLLSEQIGAMLTDPLNVSWKLTRSEGLLLMAIFDAARRQAFQAFADDEPDLQPVRLPLDAVIQILNSPARNSQWISPYLRASLKLPALEEHAYQSALISLSQKGLLDVADQTLQLANELVRSFLGLLLIEGHFILRAAVLDETAKTLNGVEIRAFQGRTGAFLCWMSDHQEIQFFSASAAGIINLAQKMLLVPWQAIGMNISGEKTVSEQQGATLLNLGKARPA